MSRIQHIDAFDARASDGRTVRIFVYQHFADARTVDNPRAEVETLRELITQDGRHVNRISDTEYDVLDPWGGFRVRRV